MKSAATMSNNALKRENVSASANVLMCKQWWKVCWMYGDQEKYYRQLYGKKAQEKKSFPIDDLGIEGVEGQTRLYENTVMTNQQGFSFEEERTRINTLDLTREIDE